MTKENSAVKSLAGKLVEIRRSLGKVEKTKRNPHFGYSYVGLEQLNALLEPKLSEKNIWLSVSVMSDDVHYGEGKAGIYSHVITEYTFIDCDTGQTLVMRGSGLGWDNGDKASPKSQTGANKSFIKSNFMISDEVDDPEAHGEPPAAKAKGAVGHSRTKPYEDETGEGDIKVAQDLLELKAYLTEHKIPDGFLLQLLQEKKLIDGHTKTVAQLKPGILRRCLDQKSKANLLKAWAAQQADEESGSETAPDPDWPEAKRNGEVRTSEGDQTRGRKPVVEISPADLLAQEGIDNWRQVKIHFGEKSGTPLGKLTEKSLDWWIDNWTPKPYKGTWDEKTLLLDAALCLASQEFGGESA